MDNSRLTPEESFKVINQAITNLKINYREYGTIFLFWGWILTFASISNFVVLKILIAKEAYRSMGVYSLGNWGLFALAGFIIQFIMLRNIDKNKKVYSHLEDYIQKLWTVACASFLIATLLCVRLNINPPPIMLLLAGMATTTSGLLIKFKPVVIGGISFFIFSIIASFVTNEYIALVVSAAIICGYLIPGYILKSTTE